MSDELPTISLVMHDADSSKVLRRALESMAYVYDQCAVQATVTAVTELKLKRVSESIRNERRVVEYQRRVALVQALIDQLPAEPKPIAAPMGEA